MGKKLAPTKYPREKIEDPRNTHEKKFGTHKISTRKNSGPTNYARRHDGTRPPTRTTMARDPLNLAHSLGNSFHQTLETFY